MRRIDRPEPTDRHTGRVISILFDLDLLYRLDDEVAVRVARGERVTRSDLVRRAVTSLVSNSTT